MSLGRARKSIPSDPLEVYSESELELAIAELRAQQDQGTAISNLEIAAAARRAGFSSSTMRRRLREDPKTKAEAKEITRKLCVEIVLRGGNVARTHRALMKKGWPDLPSERTLQKLVQAMTPAEAVSLRKGEAAARRFDLVLLRMLTERNEAWFLDAFYCRRLVYTANHRGVRNAWAFVMVDGASGCIGAITSVREELRDDGTVSKLDSVDALHAVGDAMRPWPLLGPVRGRPKVVYHDNATYFTGDTFQHALADPLLKVKTETVAPFSPWQNGPAEATIGSLRKLLLRPLEDDSYLDLAGNSLILKDRTAVDLSDHNTELVAAAIEFNQMPFRDDRSISKAEAYENLLRGEINPVPREILTRFLRRARVTVETHGVTVEREHFIHHRLQVGREVEVRYHDMDDTTVEVWPAGKFLCTAKNVRYLTDEDRETVTNTRSSSRIKRDGILKEAAALEEDWAEQRRAEHPASKDLKPAVAPADDAFGDDIEDA